MIDLVDIRYVRLGTRNIEAASRYATAVLGLQGAGSEDGTRYFRSDGRDHTLAYFEGDPSAHTVGFDVHDPAALDAAAAEIDGCDLPVAWGTGEECETRRVDRLLRFSDPSNNAIELVYGARIADREYVPSRAAGITGFSHIGLRTTDAGLYGQGRYALGAATGISAGLRLYHTRQAGSNASWEASPSSPSSETSIPTPCGDTAGRPAIPVRPTSRT